MLLFRAKVECLVYFYRPGFFCHFHKEERKTSPKNGNNEIIYVERDTFPPPWNTSCAVGAVGGKRQLQKARQI